MVKFCLSSEWIDKWKARLPLQTIMRLLQVTPWPRLRTLAQVLVPQVEKMCIDRGLTDESEILRFLQVRVCTVYKASTTGPGRGPSCHGAFFSLALYRKFPFSSHWITKFL